MAHRDDTGVGPGANDNATGTAALVELARGYAQAGHARGRARPPGAHARLPLDRRRRLRRARRRPLRQAAAVPRRRGRQPRRDRRRGAAADRDRRRRRRARRRRRSSRPRRSACSSRPARGRRGAGFGGQLLDLAFPFTLYEQGPFVARGIPAITLTTAGERPPDAFTDRRSLLVRSRLDAMGRAAQDLVGSLDQGLELAQGTTELHLGGRPHRPRLGDRAAPDRAPRAVPRRRRRPLRPLPAARHPARPRARAASAADSPAGSSPGSPSTRSARPAPGPSGERPTAGARHGHRGRLAGRRAARPRRRRARSAGSSRGNGSCPAGAVAPDELLAGETVALLALGVVALLILATNPFALIFILPAAARLALAAAGPNRPRVGARRRLRARPRRADPAARVVREPLRPRVRRALVSRSSWRRSATCRSPSSRSPSAGGACGAQLAAVSAGRYAPVSTGAGERPARGPLRELVRTIVLTTRARAARDRRAPSRGRGIGLRARATGS